MAALINLLMQGVDLPRAIDKSLSYLKAHPHHDEVLQALEKTLAATMRGEASPEIVEELGAGWVAEEALAISLYSALMGDGDFRKGVLLAVNHSGDSDSTGAVTGSLLGTMLGMGRIPPDWLVSLELRSEIEQIGADLARRYEDCEAWRSRYPIE
jgi:ADP-ribosylglycohydrolase